MSQIDHGSIADNEMARQLSFEEAAEVTDLLRTTLSRSCRIVTAEVTQRRDDYLVAMVRLQDPTLAVAVKLAGPRAPLACAFDRTAAINRLVRQHTQVPTYDVLAVDVNYRVWPWRYLITTAVPGTSLHAVRSMVSEVELSDIRRDLGQVVASLHTLQFPVYGEVGATGTVVDGMARLPALIARARRRLSNPEYVALFTQVVNERAACFSDESVPRLSHDDLNPSNLRVSYKEGRWHLSGVLDLDSAWVGDGESDLARLSLWEGMTDAAFWAGYGRIWPQTGPEREHCLIHQLLWCLEYGRSTARHQEDTQRVCEELRIPVVRFSPGSRE